MPTYDFRCTRCESQFEVSRPMGAAEPVSCPACDAPAKKVFAPVGVAFKGSGFHNTDYKTKGADKAPCASTDGCPSAATCEKAG